MKLTDIHENSMHNTLFTGKSEAAFQNQIKNFMPGTTIQGEVLEKNGNEVQILLNDHTVIKARLEQDINLEEGQMVFFQVKNNGSSFTLSPLLTNTSQADNVYKALNMAGLPVNENSVAMTDQMMKLGMSIDTKSLQTMFQDVAKFPEAPARDVVFLHKLQVPVNENNLSQVLSYEASQHDLLKGMDETITKLSEALTQVSETEGKTQALLLFRDIVVQLLPENAASENITLDKLQLILETPEIETGDLLNKITEENIAKTAPVKEADMQSEETVVERKVQTGEENVIEREVQTGEETVTGREVQTGEETVTGRKVQSEEGTVTGTISRVDAFSLPEKKTAFSVRSFETVIKALVKKEWLLSPDALSKEGEVEKVYEKMVKQLHGMEEVLNHSDSENVFAARESIRNLSSNIDFMNQINHMYTYVQLPLKMQNGDKNGELYVFTNKRNLARKEGEISALLHLNMEHLGPLDVYVKMQNGKVSTDFMVADEETLDFLQGHMQTLMDRLHKRGYDISCNMKVMEEKNIKNPVETLLEADNRAIPAFSQYAFDVRA